MWNHPDSFFNFRQGQFQFFVSLVNFFDICKSLFYMRMTPLLRRFFLSRHCYIPFFERRSRLGIRSFLSFYSKN